MVAMGNRYGKKIHSCQKNIIGTSVYHFIILWKGYQNIDFFHKIWKPYLEWYTITLRVEYFNSHVFSLRKNQNEY